MAKNKVSSVLWNSLGYMAGQAGLMLISFFTFPLFTRLLSKSDYGLLALTNTTLSMVGLIVGLGLPNAVVRFAPEYTQEKDRDLYLRYNGTMLTGATIVAALGAVLVMLISALIPLNPEFQALRRTFGYVAIVLVSRTTANVLLEFFRVARNVHGYNLLCFFTKIGNVVCSLTGFWLYRTLNGLLAGMAVGELLATAVGLMWAFHVGYWKKAPFVTAEFLRSVRFAAPMMMGSICASIMNFGDRYFIQGYIGPAAVASYAVAYDLCLYIQVLFTTSFRLSALPEIVTRYTQDGAEEAGRFLAKAFQYFTWLLIGIGFGAVAVGKQALTLLASSKYADAGNLLPWLVPGILLSGLNFLFASPLYLTKRNHVWLAIAAVSTILNTGLNIVLIPKIGAEGAAISTFVTYVAQAVAILIVSHRFLSVPFAVGSFLRAIGCGLLMFVLVTRFSPGPLENFAVKIVWGVIIYGTALIVMERQARQLLWGIWAGRSAAS